MAQLLLEEAIVIASDLKTQVQALTALFAGMPTLIEREHAAIKKSDLDAVEQLAAEKNEIGDKLESHFDQVKALSQRLVMLYEKISQEPIKRIANLSECFELLQIMGEACAKNGIGVEVLRHCLTGLKTSLTQFTAAQQAAVPKIELNKVVLNKVLTNRQENYRFWQEVSEEMMTSYNRDGQQKAKGQRSVLSVKA